MRLSKKLAALAIAAGVAVTASAAFAYWTTGGSGTGSASTGDVVAVTVHQTSLIDGLYPGQSPVALAGDFINSNAGPVYVTSVTAAVTAVTMADPKPDSLQPDCTVDDFAISGTSNTPGEIAHSASATDYKGSWSGLNVALVDDVAANQDNCKNASIEITYTAHATS